MPAPKLSAADRVIITEFVNRQRTIDSNELAAAITKEGMEWVWYVMRHQTMMLLENPRRSGIYWYDLDRGLRGLPALD